MCLLFRMGTATLSNTRCLSHSSWDQPLQMKGWNTLQLIEECSFFLIHQPLACAFEHNDLLFGMKNYFSHCCLSFLNTLSLFQRCWIFGQNLFNWCFFRKEENQKLSSEDRQAEVHDVPLLQALICTDRDPRGKPSMSACTRVLHTLLPLLLAELIFSGPSPWRCSSSPPISQASSMNSLNHPHFRTPLPGPSLTNYI